MGAHRRLMSLAVVVAALCATSVFGVAATPSAAADADAGAVLTPIVTPHISLSVSPIALRSDHAVTARAVVEGYAAETTSCATIVLYRLENGKWVERQRVGVQTVTHSGTRSVLTSRFVPRWRGRWSARLRLNFAGRLGTTTSGASGFIVVGPRWLALTFDDGPRSSTGGVLSVLGSHGVRATFFMLGAQVRGNAATARRVRAGGHQLGNHTWSHPMLAGCSDARIRLELSRTSEQIREATGVRVRVFRPPGGSTNDRVVRVAASLGMRQVRWTVDPMDWRNPAPSTIRQRVLSHAKTGSIVLMHDGGGDRSNTVAALPGIIDTLRDRGYYLVTMDEWQVLRTTR
jgi:peptidoglycan-N-acetylglucosamine deacetylase